MAKRKDYDWEAIAIDYRAGMLSLREVARKHKVDVGYLHRKAKKESWTRDLAAKVKQEVNRKLVNAAVNTTHASEAEIVDQASTQGVQVVQLHRADIKHQRDIAAGLLSDLEKNEARKVVTKAGVEVEVYASLKERSEIFRNLTQAAAKYIPLERQAWSLDEAGSEAEKAGQALTRVLDIIDGKTVKLVDDGED